MHRQDLPPWCAKVLIVGSQSKETAPAGNGNAHNKAHLEHGAWLQAMARVLAVVVEARCQRDAHCQGPGRREYQYAAVCRYTSRLYINEFGNCESKQHNIPYIAKPGIRLALSDSCCMFRMQYLTLWAMMRFIWGEWTLHAKH